MSMRALALTALASHAVTSCSVGAHFGWPVGAATFAGWVALGVVACWLARWKARRDFARRDLKPDNPTASDGSRFWGRKQAEATQGKVVTRESGGSREQAAKALAEAEREAGITTPMEALAKSLAEAREQVAYLRGALTECRRDLAEARAAQAVPVPARAHSYWLDGREVTREEFDAAVVVCLPPTTDGTAS